MTITCPALLTWYQKHVVVCFMLQGFKFNEGLAQVTWFLQVLLFDIIHLLCACSRYLYYIE